MDILPIDMPKRPLVEPPNLGLRERISEDKIGGALD
jgi:hypothetical protein